MKIQFHKPFKTSVALLVMATIFIPVMYAQDTVFLKQLEQSQYLKKVMKVDPTDAGLTRWTKKKVERSRSLPLAEDFNALKTSGPGTLQIDHHTTRSKTGSILLKTPASLPVKNPTNRSYASAEMIRPLQGEDLSGYNRFSVWVYADTPGFYSVFVGCTLYNGGKHVMPTPGRFEGQHFVTLYPNGWQQIIWEIPDLYRDSVTGFSVNIMLGGSPMGASDSMKLYIEDMHVEQVEAENSRGFNLQKNAIAYCHSGYRMYATKQALVQNSPDHQFQLINAKHEIALTGEGLKLENGFIQFDFSKFNTPGYYTLKTGNRTTKPFAIGDEAWLATAWRTLNFFFAERCGYDQPGIHQACHQDVVCVHPDGRRIPVNGAGTMPQTLLKGWVILPEGGWPCWSWPKQYSTKIKNCISGCWKKPCGV